MTKSHRDLLDEIWRMDHRGYPAYKSLRGVWDFEDYLLSIDHVQGDPFASPSSLSVLVPAYTAGLPEHCYDESSRRVTTEDFLIRLFSRALDRVSFKVGGSGKSGLLSTSHPGQVVVERSACSIDEQTGDIVMRFEAGFPAQGRSVLARALEEMLFDLVPMCVEDTLVYANIDADALQRALDLADDQQALRTALVGEGLVGFVGDGSVLPRENGVSDRPMKQAVRFEAPETMRVGFDLPHKGHIEGLGIPAGVTLIVGGGYHGKSTLLSALEKGVNNHIAGDGREYVVMDPTAVKVRAEDGRSIVGTDISPFIDGLPGGQDTSRFCTENASGSTSQAANTIEALESGAKALLIDEDTSAANFMVRDALMTRVISREHEPITPLVARAHELADQGVSLVLAVGSSGAWFTPADHVIQMDKWEPYDITERAKGAAGELKVAEEPTAEGLSLHACPRVPKRPAKQGGSRGGAHGRSGKGDRIKVHVSGTDGFSLNHDDIDLHSVEQITDREQTAALAHCLVYAQQHLMDGKRTVVEIVDELERVLETRGLDSIMPGGSAGCGLARPRRQELFAAINRWRGLRMV